MVGGHAPPDHLGGGGGLPTPVHHTTGRRERFPSFVHHSIRKTGFPSPEDHGTGRRDTFAGPKHISTG